MLACTADGGKLPPYVVFKRKTMPKDSFPQGIIVAVQEKGWFDESIMKDWIRKSFSKRRGSVRRTKSMIVLDAFRCHRTEQIKKMFQNENCVLAMIPGGLTSMLQPLDVSINKPFKQHLKEIWSEWLSSNDHTFTTGGAMKKVSMPQICQWILDAWEKIPAELIRKAFKKCCISNKMDGSEDDVVFDMCENLNELGLEDEEDEIMQDLDLFYADNVPDDMEPMIVEIF